MALAVSCDKGSIALHIVGMLLAIAALVVGPASIELLLVGVETLKVIRMSCPPTLIGSTFQL